MAGTTDTVPARLTPGEFVIKRESAEMLGLPLLEKLNSVSDGAAHSNIDSLIAEATLSQMQPIVGGGSVGNENIAGYENGGDVPKDQVLPDWSKIRPKQLLRLFRDKYQQTFPAELESSIHDRSYFVSDSLEKAGLDDFSDKWDDEYSKAMGGMDEFDYDDARSFLQDMADRRGKRDKTDVERAETDSVLSALTPAIARLYSENPDAFKYPPKGETRWFGDHDAAYTSPHLPSTRGYLQQLRSTFKKALPGFYPDRIGTGIKRPATPPSSQSKYRVEGVDYNEGGAVSDATATSAMDELLAQAMLAESAQGQSQYSMVDADRVDAEENEMMNMIMSMAIPGAGAAGTTKAVLNEFIENSIAKGVKLPKLASEIIKMQPAKGKQKVLDKIAGTMKVAPGRKVIQNPKRDLYDWKDYKVLKNTLQKPFDKMDLVNPGYMQRYTNKLVKARDKLHLKQIGGKDVRTGDVVDAVYPRGFLNVDELKRISNIIPKQYRESEIAKLLKMSKGGSQNIGGYKTGGKVPKGSHASGKWGEFGEYNKALGQPDSAGVAEQAGIIQALLDELIAEEAYKDSVQNEMDKNYLLDSLINEAPPINEMLKTLPNYPAIENPPRPTKNQFLEELLKQGIII